MTKWNKESVERELANWDEVSSKIDNATYIKIRKMALKFYLMAIDCNEDHISTGHIHRSFTKFARPVATSSPMFHKVRDYVREALELPINSEVKIDDNEIRTIVCRAIVVASCYCIEEEVDIKYFIQSSVTIIRHQNEMKRSDVKC